MKRKGYLLFKYSQNIDKHVKVIVKVKRKMKKIIIDEKDEENGFYENVTRENL